MSVAKRLQGIARRPGSSGSISLSGGGRQGQGGLLGQSGGGSHSLTYDLFFDRPRVIRAIDTWTLRVLLRQGGYARRVLRTNQRYGGKAGKTSSPGEFPRAQEGSLRRLSVFSYDPESGSVVVGPVGFARLPKGYRIRSGQTTIPQLLNEGGSVEYTQTTAESSRKKRFSRGRQNQGKRKVTPEGTSQSRRRRGGVARRTRVSRYRIGARPFIRLTQDIVNPKLAEIAGQVPFT